MSINVLMCLFKNWRIHIIILYNNTLVVYLTRELGLALYIM